MLGYFRVLVKSEIEQWQTQKLFKQFADCPLILRRLRGEPVLPRQPYVFPDAEIVLQKIANMYITASPKIRLTYKAHWEKTHVTRINTQQFETSKVHYGSNPFCTGRSFHPKATFPNEASGKDRRYIANERRVLEERKGSRDSTSNHTSRRRGAFQYQCRLHCLLQL